MSGQSLGVTSHAVEFMSLSEAVTVGFGLLEQSQVRGLCWIPGVMSHSEIRLLQ